MFYVISNVLVSIGLLFILIGIIGIIKYKNFYIRILITTKIDTVGFITIIVGLIFKHGFTYDLFSLKLLLLAALIFIINPLVAHVVASCANSSGYPIKTEKTKEDDV
jgi:multicomponent Na+:H+ antiporter subunit G